MSHDPRSNTHGDMIPPHAGPEWGNIHFDIYCSRCGYNLRMLEKPRCPECGLDFRWEDVLGAAGDRQADLFEYQCRKRPFRSWWSTFRRSFRPARFWAGVSMHGTIVPGPLWIHLLTAVPLFLLGSTLVAELVGWLAGVVVNSPHSFGLTTAERLSQLEWLETYGKDYYKFFYYSRAYYFILSIALTANLLTPMLVLLCLHRTRTIHRIRPVQVLRAFAYAGPPSFFIAGVMNQAAIFSALVANYWAFEYPVLHYILIPAMTAVVPILFLRASLKHYLRIDRPFLTAFLSGTVGILLGALIQLLD